MEKGFDYLAEQFDDIRILRYQVPAFKKLPLNEKIFIFYLSQAAIAGRDILWDQNNSYNLHIRKVLELIIKNYSGDRTTREYEKFLIYAKKVFFANGIHHHYSMDKFVPLFTKVYFKSLLANVGEARAFKELEKIIFDVNYMSKRVVSDETKDLIETSANNYYAEVTQREVEDFYKTQEGESTPVSKGLNSRLVKRDGILEEEVWKIGGKYGRLLEKIVFYLRKSILYACNEQQEKVISLLIDFYRTGDLATFDTYSIEWLKEHQADVDFINGFIEVYGDPLGYKGSWESVVEIVDKEAGERTRKLSENALWFEQHAPIDERFKKTEVFGILARVMQVAMLGGDCSPATPIGINLPNSEWIRERYGSKSVTLDNISFVYDEVSKTSGVLDEFAFSEDEKRITREQGSLGGNVHTDLHECLGHGSGRLLPGVSPDALKNYSSTIEEARADLFALYYMMDSKLVELGIIPSKETAMVEYCSYIRNGLLVQMTRVLPGNNLEESHMRNRQMIAAWVYEHGQAQNVIEKVVDEGKTYFVIRDFNVLRTLFGKLLTEVQRIKSEGDYDAAKELIETYGVKIDSKLHQEVLGRYKKLNVAPYSGFINPEYHLIEKNGEIVDVEISYPADFLTQMIGYGGGNRNPRQPLKPHSTL